MPLMVLSDGVTGIFMAITVVESSEMPPLPVSKIKFMLSEYPFTVAFKRMTPPDNTLNGKLVIFFEGPSINCS